MNEKNLEKGKATQFRSGEEAARINGAKGGIASGKTRSMKSIIKRLVALPIPVEKKTELLNKGIEADDIITAIGAEVVLLALSGDLDAYDRVIAMLGEDIKHEELALKKKELRMKEKAASESDNAELAKLDEVLGKIEGGF